MRRTLLVGLALMGCTRSTPAEPFVLSKAGMRVELPERANGVTRVEAGPGLYVELQAVGAASVRGTRVGDRVIYEGAFPATRVEHVTTAGRTEETRYVSSPGAFASLRYRFALGPGISRLRVINGYVEALDPEGRARLRTEPAFLVDARGVRRSMSPHVEGRELSFSFDDGGLTYPLSIDPAWTLTGSMATARRDEAMALLPSGKVAVLGGLTIGGDSSTVEIWDPATATFTSGGVLASKRSFSAAITLADGRVLIVGAASAGPEVYDPVTATSTLTPDTANPLLQYPTLTALGPKFALGVGGGSAHLYDVDKNTWTEYPTFEPRDTHVAVALSATKVLIAGGNVFPSETSTAEIFDLSTKTWKAAASMHETRNGGVGQPLAGGKALVAGGLLRSSSEIYDPATDTWTLGPTMTTVHSYCSSVLLKSGKMLVMGGDLPDGITDATDLYDPAKNVWTSAGFLTAPKDEFPAVVLPSGKVLIAGGSSGAPLTTAEIFDPLPEGKACLGPGECTSTFCVDGACCEKSACSTGETCGGAATPGKCLKADGNACASDAECGSAHCVDGVCCNSACTDTCAACDVTGKVGTCVAALAGDAPHGMRTACPGSDLCQSRCGGVDTKTCTQFPGTAVSCGAPTCKDGVESSARGCDGAGGCVAATTRPCDPYVCAETSCKTQCDVDGDCVEGNSCDLVTRKCVVASKCDDHVVTSPDGKAKDCTPYRCSGARCIDSCTESSVCVDGFVCDTGSQRCVPGAAAASDSGGCAYSPIGQSGLFFSLAVLFVVARGRRAAR